MKWILLLLPMFYFQKSQAFVGDYFASKAASAIALAEGADDLMTAVDDTSTTFDGLKKITTTVSEARDVMSDMDSAYYDLEYITSDMNALDEASAKLHALASKTRRIKRLAKAVGIIAIDAPTATALESARTNALLDDMSAKNDLRDINEQNRRLKALTYVARREASADKSLSKAIENQQKRDRKAGYVFHPFTVPNGDNSVKEKIIEAALGLNGGSGGFL